MITENRLEKLGIFKDATKLKPFQYWCNVTQSYIIIRKTDTEENLIEAIFREGFDQGVEEGKERKIKEIKSIFHI